jgi:hypothetical protein
MNDTAYKLAHIDKKLIKSAARKALIAADPGYYAGSPEEQERFRATMDANADKKIRQVLLDCLLDVKCAGDDVDRIWDGVPLSKLNALNWARLLTSGIGADYINELIPHDYVHGKEHGKREAGGFLWDLKIDAAGRETHLDELKRRWYAYQHQLLK